MGLKKRGFGKGKWNGFGGKVLEGETVEEAAARELEEEVSSKPVKLDKVGEISFTFPEVPKEKDWNQVVHIYVCRDWVGGPLESEEMRPDWFGIELLPFGQMWDDDKHWLPLVLEGKKVLGEFSFDKNNKVLEKKIKFVENF